MCDLCGPSKEEIKSGKRQAEAKAERLKRLAYGYERLASGGIKPHTEEWSHFRIVATTIVRDLVEDWV